MNATVIQAYPSPLLEAIETNLDEHVAFLPRHFAKANVRNQGDMISVDSRLHSDTFNKIMHARLEESEADARIDEALERFRAVDRPFAWWIGPCSRPLDLERRLAERGFQPEEYQLGMMLELKNLPTQVDLPEGFSFRRITEIDELNDFASVLAHLSTPAEEAVLAYYESSAPFLFKTGCPMELFIAYADGKPAAVSELFLSPLGDNERGLAGIHMVATAEPFRRRGLGLAMTWTALQRAQKLGAHTAALQAGLEAQSVYAALGFQVCCRFVEYQL